MASLKSILLVFAFVLFVLSAIPHPSVGPYKIDLLGAGLACWVASLLFG